MRSSDLRRLLSTEAARIIEQSGDDDVGRALGKAGRRLGIRDRAAWPDQAEVVEALAERQRLFRPKLQGEALQALREAAVEAMQFFSAFDPRLCGAVLEGTADAHSEVLVHLHADEPEAVLRFTQERRIPTDASTRRVHTRDGGTIEVPTLGFRADEVPFQLLVLPIAMLRQPPCGADGKPVQRADLARARRLAAGRPSSG